MAASMIDEDPTRTDNIGCKAKIMKLAKELKGIMTGSQDGDRETEVKHLMDAIDVGNGLVQTCVQICSSLMTAIDELAIAVNAVLDDVNQKIPTSEELSPSDAEDSALKQLIKTAETFLKLTQEALSQAGSTKQMASAIANVSTAISCDLASADKLAEESVSEANQLIDRCTTYSNKLKVDMRVVEDTIKMARTAMSKPDADDGTTELEESAFENACEEAKDVLDDVTTAVEDLEKTVKTLRQAVDEERSPVYGTKIRQATEETKESLNHAEIMQQLLDKAAGKIKELIRGIEDKHQEETSAKVKSELGEISKRLEEYQSQLNYAQGIIDTVSQIAELEDADDDLKKIIENVMVSADDTRVLILPARKAVRELEEKLEDTEDISEINLVELERLCEDCGPKCEKARKAAKATEMKMYKFIQSDPNRQKAEDACQRAKTVIEETLKVVKSVTEAAVEILGKSGDPGNGEAAEKLAESTNGEAGGHSQPVEYWQTEEMMKLAERTLQAAKKAESAASKTSKLADDCLKAVADTTTFIDPNLISNLTRQTKECEYAIFLSRRSSDELEDSDPRNWPVLGLPPRVQSPLCVLRAPRQFMDSNRNKITCSYLERSPVSPAAANQKQISMVVTPQLLSTGVSELPVPAFLAIKYKCANDFGGDIIVKSSRSRKKWAVLPTISTERYFDEFPNMVFAEVKVQSLESYAVLLRSIRSTCTVDEKGGDVVMQSKHPFFISIQPGSLTAPTDVTLETATPENMTKTLKYAEPFVQATFSPKLRKAVRLVLATRPPADRTPVAGGQVNHLYCLHCADNKRWKVTAVLQDQQEQSHDGLLRIILPPITIKQQLLMAFLWNSSDADTLEEILSYEQGKGMSKEAKERHIFEACLSDAAFQTLSKHLNDEVENLAVYLNVGDVALQKIKSSQPDSRSDQAKQVLIRWRQKTKVDNEKKVGLLRSALHKCKRLDMAQKVQNDLRDALNWGL